MTNRENIFLCLKYYKIYNHENPI